MPYNSKNHLSFFVQSSLAFSSIQMETEPTISREFTPCGICLLSDESYLRCHSCNGLKLGFLAYDTRGRISYTLI
jgi:hypothetical protein